MSSSRFDGDDATESTRGGDKSEERSDAMRERLARALSVLVSMLAYLGLAIAGSGGFHAYFSHPPLVALAIVLAAVSSVAFFAGGNLSRGETEDRSNRWVLIVFFAVGLLLGYLPAYTDREEFWTLDGDTLRWIGVALFGGGTLLRIWPVFVLGNRFSGLVAIQREHTLVTTGPYRFVRNPSYLGLIIASVGWALAFRSAIGVLLTVLMIPALVARMHAEERLLGAHFGAEYEAYRARTWRLIPWLY
jgi:protein-S-isoprenylcysteine O-methyltransferase Ste14